jgi:hypothetical protein
MITGDRKLGWKYRDLIIEQIKEELNPNNEELQNIITKLNNSSSDELERLYETFERFGVKTIIEIINE